MANSAPPVVIFSVTYLGDLVLATTVFEALRPRDITVIAAAAAASALQADERISRIVSVRSSNPLLWRGAVLRQLIRAKSSGAEVVNLELYAPRWRFLRRWCGLAGVPALHLDRPRLMADNERSARGEPVVLPHRANYYARAVHLDGPPPAPRVFVDSKAAAHVAARLLRLDSSGRSSTLVIHAGSSEKARRPPLTTLIECVRLVAKTIPLSVVLVGTKPERALCAAIETGIADGLRVENWAGELTLQELVALLATASLFIGGDSGPLKVAEAVDALTLSFWGPTGGAFAGPRGDHHRMVRFECSAEVAAQEALDLLRSERRSAENSPR